MESLLLQKMNNPHIEIIFETNSWEDAEPGIESVILSAALAAYAAGRDALPVLEKAADISVTVICTDDSAMHELNRSHRGKDNPTNVLSFPMVTADEDIPAGVPVLLGDVILGFETMCREAGEQEKPLVAHTAHLVVHGILHLLGYDHMEDGEAEKMEHLESDILMRLGYANPYLI